MKLSLIQHAIFDDDPVGLVLGIEAQSDEEVVSQDYIMSLSFIHNADACQRWLFDQGVRLIAPSSTGDADIHQATRLGSLDLLKAVIAKTTNIDSANKFGTTALMMAARNVDIPKMQELLLAGANCNAIDNQPRPVLSHVLEHPKGDRKYEALKLLLEAGANPNVPGRFNPLVVSVDDNNYKNRHDPQAALILFEHGADPWLHSEFQHSAAYIGILNHFNPSCEAIKEEALKLLMQPAMTVKDDINLLRGAAIAMMENRDLNNMSVAEQETMLRTKVRAVLVENNLSNTLPTGSPSAAPSL